ncbi:uncharacterized protein CC84DRAFT_1185669 [Paraphaeosphaeria sporulosa]|uniref:Hypervirulence associated protein TUDOR domain-containing protein n=1 Tax=Paraphaeosphaeria sporulosa TaxID=1460663 RepID=A0A177CP56_9PLEO|nr:uncharacterized protein CC84DRAFT_1185669 [Paraphaeosphaeria sporulosa]OAG08991.1 hypothetical protein CC84DRAFT_1185669 [Paraphaeosphaeria sporulosa]
MPSKDEKYTDPELRNEVKEEIQASDKGGAPGQWSARKAQMMASEYKKRGGGYTTDKKDEKAQHLDNWTEEDWQTKEGGGKAKQEDGTETRYLPKKAWEQMSEAEKEETDQKKQQGSKEGNQYVANTSKAKSARKHASKDTENANGKPNMKDAQSCTHHWEDEEHLKNGQKAYQEFKEQNKKDGAASVEAQSDSGSAHSDDQEHPTPKKRGRGANASGSNKKQKTSGGSDERNGSAGDKNPAGDKNRVPQVGQKVQWKALPGYVDGEVVEVAYEEKTVEGKAVKASKEDPRIVLKSSSSGKIAVHKPEAVYFN